MEVYGIRLSHNFNYGAIEGIMALEQARRAIEERIGMDSVIGTMASHSLEETFFLVKERCLAEEAVDAIFNEGVLAEYIPLNIREETQESQEGVLIGRDGRIMPLT